MLLFDYFTLKIIWWLFVLVLLIGFALLDGFRIVSIPDPVSVITPLDKTVELSRGAGLQNYAKTNWMILAPVLAFGGGLLAFLFSRKNRPRIAFIFSGSALAGVILTTAFAMFPFIFPFSTNPNNSLRLPCYLFFLCFRSG
jgi:cytochrome d ubiquinol oxidase subunit II